MMTTRMAILRKQGAPDMGELRRLLEAATGVTWGWQRKLAELVGCGPSTVRAWMRGKPPSPASIERIRVVERMLRERGPLIEDEPRSNAAPAPSPERPLPLYANIVEVRAEGDQALLIFRVSVPGEEGGPRTVAAVLVPRSALASAIR